MEPTISVVTPTYNRAKYIAETIESVLSQDYKNFEYIIIDDGSTDETEKIVKLYLNDRRVKYIYQKNIGEAGTVNKGWQMSRGEYFVQINSDDPILPGLLSKMVAFFEKYSDASIVYPDYQIIDGIGNIIREIRNPKWNFLKHLAEFSCYAASPGTFIKKTDYKNWDKIRDIRYHYISDVVMYWKMALTGKFYHLSSVLTTWRDHETGISSTRYKSIPEIELWFKEYYSETQINKKVLKLKKTTRTSIDKYFINLLEESETKKNKKEIDKYKRLLGIPVYRFKNLQIGDNDLIGNKFNGHDLHKYLRERKIDSSHLVWNKESNDKTTYQIDEDSVMRQNKKIFISSIQKKYKLDNIVSYISYSILYNKLFLNTEVAHLHLINNIDFDLQLLPIMSKLKPLVWTLHDIWALSGFCQSNIKSHDKGNCVYCTFMRAVSPHAVGNELINYEIKRKSITESDFDVIVSSKWMEKKVNSTSLFNNKKIHVIPFGINQEIFKIKDKLKIRKTLGIPENDVVLIFRSGPDDFKGTDFIDYVIKNLKSKKTIFIICVGNAERKLDTKFKTLNLPWIKNDEYLADLYNASDIILMPSKVDSFGMMAIEAMSCGVLPIVLEGTALPDTVNAPECGVSVRSDKNLYLKTVAQFIDNNKERNIRIHKCLVLVKKRYNLERYVKQVINVYESAMKRHRLNPQFEAILRQLKKNAHDKKVAKTKINYDGFDPLQFETQTFIPQGLSKWIILFIYKIDKILPKHVRHSIKKALFYFLVLDYSLKQTKDRQ